jgi:hypothetical protein
MSRDPSRELDDFRDWLYAKAEREAEERAQQQPPPNHAERASSPERQSATAGSQAAPDPRFAESRSVLYDRDRGYRVRASELRTLTDLGRFRVVGVENLVAHAYCGDRHTMQDDLRNLLRQGLIRQGMFRGPEETPRELLTLSKRGYRLLRANRLAAKDQPIYHGIVKPREANHDADLYTLYQKEAARIQAEGGRPIRVLLDFELKKRINHDFAKFGTDARKEIAARHGLRVIRGKIPVPDLRIEYERPDGEVARVDLELVTEHYRGRCLADKVRAGFSLYAQLGEGDRLRRVLDQRELAAEILSL